MGIDRFDSSRMTFVTVSDAGGLDSSPPVEGGEDMVYQMQYKELGSSLPATGCHPIPAR